LSESLPGTLNIADSILFVGSGFTRGATNIAGSSVPTGAELRAKMASLLNMEAGDFDFRDIAEALNERSPATLYNLLYESFTVAQLKSHQEIITSLPWRRIYTTNYDDALEVGLKKAGRAVRSFSYLDQKPRELWAGSVIHLHGDLRGLTEENALSRLVLGEKSYVEQQLKKSTWFSEFVRDLRFSAACFFVGYSLSDHHISALLLQDPSVTKKTYFASGAELDPITRSRLGSYGNILPIASENFGRAISGIPAPRPISDPHKLRSFVYLDPFKDKKTLLPPTADEVMRLMTFGTFNAQRCLSALPDARYLIPRKYDVGAVRKSLDAVDCVLLHSNIGNGKTLFLYILAYFLSSDGYQCFLLKPRPEIREEEIEVLRSFESPVIMIDSFIDGVALSKRILAALPGAKLVITMRTGIQDVRRHELQEALPSNRHEQDLNRLHDDDRRDFFDLLSSAGATVDDMEDTIVRARDVRDVVLTLYRNEGVRKNINDALAMRLTDGDVKRVIIMSSLLKALGQDDDAASFIRVSTGLDLYVQLRKLDEFASDMFSAGDDGVYVRSALFAEYLMAEQFEPGEVLNCAFDLIVTAVAHKSDRRYRSAMSALMQMTNLKKLLRQTPDYLLEIVGLYERLRTVAQVNDEPLFWLQYAIAMIEMGDLASAEKFIETSYARARKLPEFKTFQIDTQALRLYLLLEAGSAGSVSRVALILDKGKLVREMLGNETHRSHALRVLRDFAPFLQRRIGDLTGEERRELAALLDSLVEAVEGGAWADAAALSQNAERTAREALNSLREARSLL